MNSAPTYTVPTSEAHERRNGHHRQPSPEAQQLSTLLGLDVLGRHVAEARIVGRGSRASADLWLDDGTHVYFETLRDFGNPTRLALELVACTGATPSLKGPQAMAALRLLRAIASHEETLSVDHLSVEWGGTFLQAAQVLDVNMDDQAERWGAFCHLDKTDPLVAADVASASVVLRHYSGIRYVRCGWFAAHVRRQDGNVSPQEIAHRMQRVGWTRRGRNGRIKATRPGHEGSLLWTFYAVPAGWEEQE